MTNELKPVYSGSSLKVKYYQEILQNKGISSFIRNEMESGLRAGFGAGTPENSTRLFVKIEEFEKAQRIIKELED